MDCIFCKIIKGDIPAIKVFEDEDFIIINDIAPQAKHHYLLIPKEHYASIKEMSLKQSEVLGRALKKLGALISELGLNDGFRLVSNCGSDACQSVEHLHIHIVGGNQLSAKMC